jgi:hypothetical protein
MAFVVIVVSAAAPVPAINISRSNKSRAVLTFEVFQET